MKRFFPLSQKVNPDKPISMVAVGLIYVISTYLVRFLFGIVPVFTFVFNLLAAVATLYSIVGITVAIMIYLKKL